MLLGTQLGENLESRPTTGSSILVRCHTEQTAWSRYPKSGLQTGIGLSQTAEP